MFKFFKRKRIYIKLEHLPTDERWSVAEGVIEGVPTIMRANSTAGTLYNAHPLLPIRMGIAIPLNAPDDNGFPSESEGEQLNDIEDHLTELLGQNGRLVLVISSNGMREFVSYIDSESTAKNTIGLLTTKTTTHKIQAYAEIDKKWDLFKQFNSLAD